MGIDCTDVISFVCCSPCSPFALLSLFFSVESLVGVQIHFKSDESRVFALVCLVSRHAADVSGSKDSLATHDAG